MRLVGIILVLFVLVAQGETLFEDDFDSYPDGYDLDDSPDWDYIYLSGISIDKNGGDGAATTAPWNRVFIGATGAQSGENYAVSCAFSDLNEVDGGHVYLCLRVSGLTRALEMYYLDIHPSPEGCCIDLMYYHNGESEMLSGICIMADPDEWYRVGFSALGPGPVDFEVYFDESLVYIHTEETYIAPAGIPAFGFDAGDNSPRVDGFIQTDGGASVVETSFGWIKARF